MKIQGTFAACTREPRVADSVAPDLFSVWLVGLSALSRTAIVGLALALMLIQLVAASIQAQSIDEQTVTIAKQLKCPVCQNIPVAYSQSQLAEEMRLVIREKVAQGESEAAIVQYFVDRYGEDVLLEPRREGFSLLLWVTAVSVLLCGAAVVGVVLWNWSQSRPAATSAAAAATDSSTPNAGALEQVFEEEFARYKQGKRS